MERNISYFMLGPTVLVLGLLSVVPMAIAAWLVFHEFNPLQPGTTRFVGLQNILYLAQDSRLFTSTINTTIFVFAAISLEFGLGLALALLFNWDMPGARVFRALLLLPVFTMPMVVGMTFRMLFDYRVGLVNWFLTEVLGTSAVYWLGDPLMAKAAVVIADVWHYTPFVMFIFLAGLKSLPVEPFEAAKVDGANAWQTFWRITFPLLRPVILVILLFRLMIAFRIFDEIYVMTEGGPGSATEMLSNYVFAVGFRGWQMGYAATLSYAMLAVVGFISLLLIRALERETGL